MTERRTRTTDDVYIGTAGWSIPKDVRDRFPQAGTVLERYAQRLHCVEINSTFYRSHRPATFERWAAAVPDDFRFSLKIPKAITHERRLLDCDDLLDRFLDETAALGNKRAVLLVQLPPKFAIEPEAARAFFHGMRTRTALAIVFEPRHPSWFSPEADALLRRFAVARAGADPSVIPEAGLAGGNERLAYYRLHGVPRTYYSAYEPPELERYASLLKTGNAQERWCIFDNTASGAATSNALSLEALLNSD